MEDLICARVDGVCAGGRGGGNMDLVGRVSLSCVCECGCDLAGRASRTVVASFAEYAVLLLADCDQTYIN